MRFPSSDILLNLFIDKFNLPMNTFQEYNPNTYYYVNNILAKTKEVGKNISLLNFNLTAEELALNSPDKIYDNAIQPILHDAAEHGWAYTVNKYGHFNIKTYLDQSGISPGAVRMIGVILDEGELFSTSMLESIRDSLTINDLTVFREFVGGTHKLLEPFFEELKDDILMHCKVVAIEQDSDTEQDEDADNISPDGPSPIDEQVLINNLNNIEENFPNVLSKRRSSTYGPTVETVKQSNGKVHVKYYYNLDPDHPPTNNPITLTGDYCIMTATAKASLLIDYDPPLSQNKRSALYDLHYDQSTKIFLYFSQAFWIEEGIVGGKSITDGFSRFIYYPSHNFTRGGAILASYTWGDDAIFWLSLDDEQCKQMALDTLSTIHSRDLSSLYVSGVVKKWTNDNYSHGAFALFTPTQERDLYEYLYQSEGNVLFAGEHTTLKHAWVEGAMISALRSVVQITHDSYDIAVVGGGPIGLAAALFCAKQGKSVVVLEKFTFKNGNGSANGATRQFREMYAEKLLAEFATDAVDFWKDLEDWSGKKLLYQDGYLFFGNPGTGKTTEGDFDSIKKVCDELQLDCESVTNCQLESEFYFNNTPTDWIGLFQQASGQIDVQETLAALIQLAEENDVDLVDNVDIDDIQFENGNINLKFKSNSVEAKKTILAPGPYANELFEHLGFQINLDIWELPSFYYKIKPDIVYPTWFAFGGDTQSLFYGFPENSWERPGYTRVSPDFVKAPIKNPSERTNIPDHDSFVKTTEFVRSYMPDVDPDDSLIENTTCLATMVPDGGFVLDFAPGKFVQNNRDVVIFAAGWGFKFVPLYGKMLADLAVNGTTNYNITAFSINRSGVLMDG